MLSFNSITLLGHVGQAPEIYTFPDGGRKATLKIATNTGSGDNKKTQWHTLILYNKAADLVSRLVPGDAIMAEGSLEYRQWTDQYGQNRLSPEIMVTKFSIVRGELGQAQDEQYQGGHQANYSQGSYQNVKGNGYDNRPRQPQGQGYANQGQRQSQRQGYGNQGQRQNQGYAHQGQGYNQRGYANQGQGYNQNGPRQGYNQRQGQGYGNPNQQYDMA